MSAPCDRIFGHLDAYLSGELAEETRREVEQHLAGCAQCAAELETRGRVRKELQAAVRATTVPGGLEAKIQRAVRGQVSRPRTGLWAVAAAAAVIACFVLVRYWRAQANPVEAILRKNSGRMATMLNVGLRDHLQCAVFRGAPIQPDPASQIAADLGPDFAGLAPLLQAKLPDHFRILEGHHCSAAGRQYTHFIIAGGGKLVSVILTRKQPGESLSGGIHQSGVDRFQVVGFESHDYLAYVISDLDAVQNLQWAANLAPTMREFLAGPNGSPWGRLFSPPRGYMGQPEMAGSKNR